jgi:hypothetical protein
MPSPSRDFYPPEFTDRSRSVVNRIHEAVHDAVLIGGWATWVRTGGPMSHDVDLIVTRPQLVTITQMTDDMSESRHLAGRKWRASLDGIHLDLYVPHQSRLGQHLQLRTERLIQRREIVHEWVVLDPPGHLATKLAALLDRPDSSPGEKDRHEIMALLAQGVDTGEAVKAVHDASARAPHELTPLIDQAFVYLGDLPLDRSERRNLNELARDWHALSLGLQQSMPPSQDAARQRRLGPERSGPDLGL